MITRLYTNNFRCLVAFKAEFDSFAVLCGPNGSGKSSVFDALRLIRDLGTGDGVLGGDRDHDVAHLEFTKTVLIDEPANYVGLPELQPWVLSLRELLDDQHQAILITHHPEILSSAGQEHGRYLWRDNHTSPTRIGPLSVPEGMSPSEAIARGWVRA